jgi:hypothetical protein
MVASVREKKLVPKSIVCFNSATTMNSCSKLTFPKIRGIFIRETISSCLSLVPLQSEIGDGDQYDPLFIAVTASISPPTRTRHAGNVVSLSNFRSLVALKLVNSALVVREFGSCVVMPETKLVNLVELDNFALRFWVTLLWRIPIWWIWGTLKFVGGGCAHCVCHCGCGANCYVGR